MRYSLKENQYSYENLIKKEDLTIENLTNKVPLTSEGKIDQKTIN